MLPARLGSLLVLGLWTCSGLAFESQLLEFDHDDEIIRGSGFAVVADRRIFAVTAFLNATGYDAEADGEQMHPVRLDVRRQLERSLAGKDEQRKKWVEYARELELPMFVYLDFALSLSADYPFRRIRPDEELGYPAIAERLSGLPAMLNEFWETTELGRIWEAIKPAYRAELERYDFPSMSSQMAGLWEYLRMKRTDTYTVVNVPALLVKHYEAIGARYENYYYTVESPGAQSYSLNLHEYMHSIVNPLVEGLVESHDDILRAYFESGKDGPLAESYGDLTTFGAECVVRALDYRLRLGDGKDVERAARVRERVSELNKGGLTLVEPVFEMLEGYEKSDQGFDRWLPGALRELAGKPPGRIVVP